METILIVLSELEEERKRLLKNKAQNQKKIEELEQKISHYEWLYKNSMYFCEYYEAVIDSYKKLNLKNFEEFVSEYTKILKEKKRFYKKRASTALACRGYYINKRDLLLEEISIIEEKLSSIDLRIYEIENPPKRKVHILERRKEND